jgi:hypothetical protein
MKLLYRLILLTFLFADISGSVIIHAQTSSMRKIERNDRRGKRALKRDESKKVRDAKKKAEQQKKDQKKAYEKAKKEDNKRRMDLQTPETRERMKEAQKMADANNNRGREPFFKRIFKRKKPKSL